MERKFKCKDEVIYQNRVHFGDEKLIWNYGIVNYEDEGYVYLVGGLYVSKKAFNILPYEGNEHLVGTTDEPDEEVRLEEGEVIIVFDRIEHFLDSIIAVRIFIEVGKHYFTTNASIWGYAVKFSDFNPNDMEETKKHILCVKNGKVVRYKG